MSPRETTENGLARMMLKFKSFSRLSTPVIQGFYAGRMTMLPRQHTGTRAVMYNEGLDIFRTNGGLNGLKTHSSTPT